MANTNVDVPYIVVVSTNMYAGSFERDMTAYCTGSYGECGVGDDQAELFREETSEEIQALFEDALSQQPDDRGCHRPCSIWNLGKNTGYNDVAMFFDCEVTQQMLEAIKDRAVEFSKEGRYNGKMQIKSVTLIGRTVTTVDTILSTLK